MTRASLDISQLPHDVLIYSNQRFFDFIESFCGKDEADLLSIKAIRSADSFLSVQDVYSIFAIDSENVIEIQARYAFKNRNGTFTVKPGIKSSLNYISSLLTEMKTKTAKRKKTALVSTPSILSIQSTVSILSTVSIASSYSINSSPGDSAITPFVSTKTVTEHHEFITTSIEQWCNQNKNDLNLRNLNFVCGIDYHLKFSSSLDKVAVICSCGLKSFLVRADSGNFKVSNYFRHLKTTCSIVQSQSIDNSTEHEQIRSNIVISRDSSLLLSSQQPSTVSTIKRARQTTAVNINKKKLRTT
ncbi:unnamed protein product [Rotaria magnacalcarata]|uniref:Uncharacterized protein n=1 Tax=Rotaria magnacalcarata TaxID=392030 RepID=A0A816F6E9_9BILA|nr:unnamed protein product [Rotaria magnacalcarata]CAF4175872.1 unnamed protein product [Rotaria magnacalcarata]